MRARMPSLTIEGKRQIIAMAIDAIGEEAFLNWLHQKNIPSIRYIYEQVRKYKAKFFRELFDLTEKNSKAR